MNYKKIPSLFISLCLAANQCLLPAKSEAAVPHFPRAGNLPRAEAFHLALPRDLGHVRTFGESSGPIVFHILTSHGNYECQKKIQAILHYLRKTQNIDTVLVEGSAFFLDASRLQIVPEDPKLNQEILDELAKEALVKGVELFHQESPSVKVLGIENLKAYQENRELFKAVLSQRDQSGALIRDLNRKVLERAAQLNPGLRSFWRSWNQYQAEQLAFPAWLRILKKEASEQLKINLVDAHHQREWPMLVRFFKIEKFSRVLERYPEEKEQNKFWKTLPSSFTLPPSSFLPPASSLEYLVESLGPDFDWSEYPGMKNAIGEKILTSELDAQLFQDETNRLTGLLLDALAKTQEEKETVLFSKDVRGLEKLLNLELTPEEYEKLEVGGWKLEEEKEKGKEVISSNFKPQTSNAGLLPSALAKRASIKLKHSESLDLLCQKALEFYERVYARDPYLIQNSLKHIQEKSLDKVVLITGGFHTQAFETAIQKQGYRHVVITPAITDFKNKSGQEAYIRNVLGYARNTLEDIYTSDSMIGAYGGRSEIRLREVLRAALSRVLRQKRLPNQTSGQIIKDWLKRWLCPHYQITSKSDYDLLPDPIFVKNGAGIFIYVNPAFVKFLSAYLKLPEGQAPLTQEDVIGRTEFDFFSPEAAQTYQANDREAMRQTPGTYLEWIEANQVQGGAIRHVLVKKTAWPYEENGQTQTGVLGMFVDISEQIQDKERFKRLFEHSLDGVALHELIYDNKGRPVNYRYLAVNPAFKTHTGIDPDEVIGKSVTDALGISEPPFLDIYLRVLADGQSTRFEMYFEKINRWFDVQVFSPAAGQFATVFTDITDRKKAENAHQEILGQLRKAQKIGKLGSWNLDLKTGKLVWSDEIFNIFEVDPNKAKEWSNQNFLELVHPEDRDRVNQAYKNSVTNKTPYSIEHRILMRDGRVKWVLENCETEYDSNGSPVRSTGTVQEITERKSLEEELRKSAEKFRVIAESAKDAIILMDQHGNVVYWNPAAERIFGWSKEEILGQPVHEHLMPPQYEGAFRIGFKTFYETGTGPAIGKTLQLTARHKDGHEFPIEISLASLWNLGPENPFLATAIIRDVSESMAIQQALKESQQQLADIIDFLPDATFVIDRDRRVIAWNRAIEEMTGKTAKEMIGRSDYALPFYGEERNILIDLVFASEEEIRKHYKSVSVTGEGPTRTVTATAVVPLGGRNRILWGKAVLLYNSKGELVGAIESIRDITEEETAKKALQESEARFRQIFFDSQVGLATASGDGLKLLEVNQFYADMLGYTMEELRSMSVADYSDPKDMEKEIPLARDLIAGRIQHYDIEKRYLRKDGQWIWVSISVSAVRKQDDTIDYLVGIAHDITARKIAEEALRQSEEKFREIFEKSSTPMFIHDPKTGEVIDANHAAAVLNGVEGLEAIREKSFWADPPYSAQDALQWIHKAASEGPQRFEWLNVRKDGERLWTEVFLNKITINGLERVMAVAVDITERKQAEGIMKMRLNLMEFSQKHTLDELLQETLDEVEALTGSQIGFYHFIAEDEQTLTLRALSTGTKRDFCRAQGQDSHYPLSDAGVWADSVRQKRPLIHNDYASLSGRKGLPQGHAEVIREMVVPIMRDGKVVAVLGVGNKLQDYTSKDLDVVTFAANVVWDIADLKIKEEAILASQKRLYELFHFLPVGIATVSDQTLRFLEVNEFFAQMLGYTREELQRMTVSDISFEEDMEKENTLAKELFEGTKDSYQMEKRYRKKDGGMIWVLLHVRAVRNHGGGKVLNLISAVQDITAKKQAEEERLKIQQALKESERMYREAIEASGAVPYYQDYGKNTYSFVGKGIETLTGYSPEEFTFDVWRSLILEAVLMGDLAGDDIQDAVQKARGGSVPLWRADYKIRTRSGEIKWVANSAIQVRDENGVVVGSLGTLQDITDRRNILQALQESEDKFRSVFNNSKLGISILDENFHWGDVNDAYLKILGYTREELLSMDLLSITHPDDREQDRERIGQLRSGAANSVDYEKRYLHKDGHVIWVHVTVSTIRDPEGRVEKTYAIVEDITERRKLEEERLRLQSKAALQSLARDVNHDVKNTVMPILSELPRVMELIAELTTSDQRKGPVFKQIMKLLQSSNGSAIKIADMMLELAILTQSGATNLSVINVSSNARAVMDAQSDQFHGIDFESEFPEKPLLVEMNEAYFDRVILNLIVNAGEAIRDSKIQEGRVDLRGERVTLLALPDNINPNLPQIEEFSPGDYVKIQIQDNGPGISAEVLKKMFEVDFTTKSKGSGIGLATVWSAVKTHHGFINVTTRCGQGTTFDVYLPATDKPYEESSEISKDAVRGDETIWLLEDNSTVRKTIQEGLEELGYTVLAFSEPAMLFEYLTQKGETVKPPDVYITDMNMPFEGRSDDAAGVKAYGSVMGRLGPIKSIMISGQVGEDVKERGWQLGMDVFLDKPFRPLELAQKIRSLFPEKKPKQPSTLGVRRVLLIEDEPSIIGLVPEFIRVFYPEAETIVAQTGQQAEEVIKNEAPFDVVLLDQGIPGGVSELIAQQINERDPKTTILISSGGDLKPQVQALMFNKNEPDKPPIIHGTLPKPFVMVDVGPAIEKAIKNNPALRAELRALLANQPAKFTIQDLAAIWGPKGPTEGVVPMSLGLRREEILDVLYPRQGAAQNQDAVGFMNRLESATELVAPVVHVRDLGHADEILETAKWLVETNRAKTFYVAMTADTQDAVDLLHEKLQAFAKTEYPTDLMKRNSLLRHLQVFESGNRLIPHFLTGKSARTVWLDWVGKAVFDLRHAFGENQILANQLADGTLISSDLENKFFGASLLQAVDFLLQGPIESHLVKSPAGFYVQASRSSLSQYDTLYQELQSLGASA